MKHATRTQSGYTMIEVAIVGALALAVLAAIGVLLGSTQGLVDETRTNMRATAEHRKNLRELSSLLRTVDITTLAGFDAEGVATEPSFQRVAGADLVDRSYEGTERLQWKPDPEPVWGVERPGAVHLIGPEGERVIARNVPADGFVLRQEGSALAIQLTTYFSLGARRTYHVSSETAVSLRN